MLDTVELNLNRGKLNVNRGAIALGHPLGYTGTRTTVTRAAARDTQMQYEARRATLCVSGGMVFALETSRESQGGPR